MILRYDAYSTNSIYLKLDYGVSRVIRISDHEGKKHFANRYNIGTNINEYYYERDHFDRFYYPVDQCDILIKKIIRDRQNCIFTNGIDTYKKYMMYERRQNKQKSGFWQQAKLAVVKNGKIEYRKKW